MWLRRRSGLITPEKIDAEHNQEVRRAMIERYGYDRYTRRAKVVHADATGAGCAWTTALVALTTFGAWLTHVMWIIRKLAGDGGVTAGQMVLGVIGAVVPPVGVIHGLMIWVGLL